MAGSKQKVKKEKCCAVRNKAAQSIRSKKEEICQNRNDKDRLRMREKENENMARVKSQKSQKRRKAFVRFLPIYILMLPGLIYLFINNYMPLPGLVIAFKQYNAGKGSTEVHG